MFDVSLAWADFWYDAFNVMLFVGAFAVAVGTYGSIKMGAVKERFSDERTNILEATLGVAQADIAKANAQIAEANARTKEAELALARLNSDRKLTDDQMRSFVATLRPYAGNRFWITVQKGPMGDDSEQEALAKQLEQGFLRAGWMKDPHTLKDAATVDPPTTGIANRGCRIASANDAATANLAKLVHGQIGAAGIDCQLRNSDPLMAPDLVFIEIGLR